MLRIRICHGMFCATAGGNRLDRAFEEALEKAGVADQVEVLTAHCLGSCDSGPCVRIGGEKYHHVTPEDVPGIVRDDVLPQLEVG